jgi:D-arabinose 1-dehydrogenase-like Zn-dependent alcohol dehydrogenase
MTNTLKTLNTIINNTSVPIVTYATNTTSGQFLTSTGSNGTTWATGTVNNNPALTVKQTNPPELEVKGRMVINGRDLEERLDTIEKVLHIPERDVILEKKHPKLKKLYDEYINELSKYKMWHSIKGDND